MQLKLSKANENAGLLQRSLGEATLKAEQSQREAAKKHEEEKRELLGKLLDLVRRRSVDPAAGMGVPTGSGDSLRLSGFCRRRRWK